MTEGITSYRAIKAVSNNIVRARDINDREVFLTGKGIGFGTKPNDTISSASVESVFSLIEPQERSLYDQLLKTTSPALIEIANDAIRYIQSQFDQPLNEHIHVALTDHIAFLVRRCKLGIPIENPFLTETTALYPRETGIATNVIKMLEDRLHLHIPDDEIGFISLHIITSLSQKTITKLRQETLLLENIISIIENQFHTKISKDDLNYSRLVTHLRFLLERMERGESLSAPEDMITYIRQFYPVCYNTAYKLIMTIQQFTGKRVPDGEIFYLAMHVYRFSNSLEAEE